MGKGLGNDVESRRQFRTVQPDLDHTTFFKSSVPAVTKADRWVASLLKDPRDTRLVYCTPSVFKICPFTNDRFNIASFPLRKRNESHVFRGASDNFLFWVFL